MNFKNKWFAVFLLTFILFAAEILYFYPRLPDTVASHFNVEGDVDNYMNKNSFVLFVSGVYLVITSFFLILTWRLPSISTRHINLPYKETVLNESNKKESYAKISLFFIKLAVLTNAFFFFLFLLSSYVSINNLKKLPSIFFVLLALYVGAMILLFVGFNKDMRSISEKNT